MTMRRQFARRSTQVLVGAAAFLVLCAGVVYYGFPGAVIEARVALARSASGVACHAVEVGDHTWPYLSGGEGEPVVVLHGFGLDKDRALPLSEAFRGTHRLILPDLPAFGENRQVEGADYGIEPQAGRLHRFVEALGLETFHLVGHSYGGGIAAWYASEHPEKIESLTLVAAFGVDPGKESVLLEQWRQDRSKTLCVDSREDLERVFSLAYRYPPDLPEHFEDYIARQASRHHDSHARIFERLEAQLGALEPRLHLVRAPTLVLWGKEDQVLPASSALAFARGIEDSRVVIIPDAGHAVLHDQRQKTLAAMSDFLAARDD